MTAHARTFEFKPAVREQVSLIIAIAGASGGGKTLSALKIARGLAGGDDNRIAVIDTEAGRAKHYAVAPGEKPGPERFAFQHVDLRAPFTPEAYSDAIRAADEASRFDVIMVDSCSHEYEGEGGLHDMHDTLVAEAVAKARSGHNGNYPFDEDRVADKASVGAWNEPKSRHKRFVSRLLQCRAHLILCLRADEKIRIEKVTEKGSNGREYTKTVIVQPKDMPPNERWVPICEKRFMYEMTISCIVAPQAPGVPVPIKLQAQHRAAFPLDKPLDETTGRALAKWATGGQPSPHVPPSTSPAADPPASSQQSPSAAGEAGDGGESDSDRLARIDRELSDAAAKGTVELREKWQKIPPSDQAIFKTALDRRYKPAAAAADQKSKP